MIIRNPRQRWQKCQRGQAIGYRHISDHIDPQRHHAGLMVVADSLEIMCDLAPDILDDPAEINILRQDADLAWVLGYCAAFRSGHRTEPPPEVIWPELETSAESALRTLRDPDSDSHALHNAYQAVSRAVRSLGSSSAIADTVADLWQQHINRHNSGEDQ